MLTGLISDDSAKNVDEINKFATCKTNFLGTIEMIIVCMKTKVQPDSNIINDHTLEGKYA